MLTYQLFRYTDFLVNEILPSGIVVHLNNLKLPQPGKLTDKSTNAKIAPFVSVGTASPHHPSTNEPNSSVCKNDDRGQPDASSEQATKELQTSHDKAETVTSNDDTYERDDADKKSKLTKQGQRTLELQPASGPRQKEKILMRQTSSELLLVGDNEEVFTQQTTGHASATMNNGNKEDEGSPQNSAQLKTAVVGEIGDTEHKAMPEPSRTLAPPSSAADWQAYADVPEGFQVRLQLCPVFDESDSLYSFRQKIKSFLYLTLVPKLLIQF